MKKERMTIKQAQQLLGCANEHQLSKAIGVSYQAVQHWRKELKSLLPHPWPEVVKSRASAT